MKNPQTRIRALRKKYDLTQEEFASLIGAHQGSASRIEHGEITPEIELVFGAQVVFGTCARDIFHGLYAKIEDAVMRRAAALDAKLRENPAASTPAKQRLLTGMALRAGRNSHEI